MVSMHVDDFDLNGTESFVEEVTEKISAALDVSQVENDHFRFTGIDVRKVEDGIEISMEDYARSLEEIEVREDRSDEILSKDKLKVVRKYVGKLNWLATITRTDIAI